MRAGAASRAALVATSIALVAGCSALPGTGEDSSATDGSDTTSSRTSGSPEDGDPTDSGRVLDTDALEQAMPDPGDIGTDWTDDPQGVIGEVEASAISPGSCAPLLMKDEDGDSVLDDHHARVQANYAFDDSTVGFGNFMGIWAYSTDRAVPTSTFDEAGSLFGSCSTMDVTQADTGTVSAYETRQLAFPNLGDRTLALRMEVTQTVRTVTMDFVVVKVGHTTLFVAQGDYLEEPDTAATEKAVRAALENLEEGA